MHHFLKRLSNKEKSILSSAMYVDDNAKKFFQYHTHCAYMLLYS